MLAVGTRINTPISSNRFIVKNNHHCNSYNFNKKEFLEKNRIFNYLS